MKHSLSRLNIRLRFRSVTPILLSILLLAGFQATQAQAAKFTIATGGASMDFAFDGTNYLVGVENHQDTPTSIGARMIDASGNLVGSYIDTGSDGISTNVAFDGDNYLLIWEYDPGGDGSGRFQIYGQFIDRTGAKVGSPFAITTAGIWFDGVKTMAFGGGKYLVTYTRLIDPDLGDDSTNRYIAGRIVSPNGSMGSEFRISSGYGAASGVAFDGTNFFVVWVEDQYDYEIRGRFVSTSGVLGTEISIDNDTVPSDNPKAVAFDGTNYLVVWSDEDGGAGTGTWNVYGQRVSTSGTLVGGVITITNEAGAQVATTVSFDGINYLATWVDMTNPSNWNLYGQYVGTSGSLVGTTVTIDAGANNQMGGAGFANGRYLALINDGIVMGEHGITSVSAVYGLFMTPAQVAAFPTISQIDPGSGPVGTAVAITGSNFVSGGTSVTFNGVASTDVTVTDLYHLTAYVPEGATTGTVRVTTSGGSVTGGSFTVTASGTSTLTVYLSGTGSGTVTATSGVTLSCSSPETICSVDATYGTEIELSETERLGSTFAGWSGACSATPCSFTLYNDTSVTATFTLQQNLRKGSGPSYSYYGTLKSAFADAASGDVILARSMLLPDLSGDAAFDKSGAQVSLIGGYTDSGFTTRSATDFTSVTYPLTIVDGALIVDQIAIK